MQPADGRPDRLALKRKCGDVDSPESSQKRMKEGEEDGFPSADSISNGSTQFKAVWSILGLIDSKLRQKVGLAHIFGKDGQSVLLQTTDDEVYTYGLDAEKSGYLGQGQGVPSVLHPKQIEVLSKKGVHSVAFGSDGFVVAATAEGEIYRWGTGAHRSHSYSRGHSRASTYIPTPIVADFGLQNICKIACGNAHALILTDAGQVYSFGTSNANSEGQLGQSSSTSHPGQITPTWSGGSVVDIACATSSSYALLDNGELYGWGSNVHGEIGISANIGSVRLPHQVILPQGTAIKQVVCGQSHFLALSSTGIVYSCGNNNEGQLGNGTTFDSLKAIQLPAELGRFAEVAATHFSNLSAALSESGDVYVWGHCRLGSIKSPMKTELSSLDDAFACYSSPPVTWRPLTIITGAPQSHGGDVLTSLKESLSEGEDIKDVTFIVEDREIRSHKAILMIRCEYFRKMFQNDWREQHKEGITIKDFTYDAYRAFIEYLYTGSLASSLGMKAAVDLLQIADCYQEMKLKSLCEEVLAGEIQVDNCVYLYGIATRFQAEQLQASCAQFGAHNMKAVIATDHFVQMSDSKAIQGFLLKTGDFGAFKN